MTVRARALAQFRPDCLLTLPVVLGSYLWAVAVNLGDGLNNPTGRIPERLAVLAVAHIALFLPAWALSTRLHASARRERATVLLMLALLLGMVLRGAVFAALFYAAGLAPDLALAFRIGTSIGNLTVAVGLLWLVVSTVRTHAERRAELTAEHERLQAQHADAARRLEELDMAAAERVRTSILSSLGNGDPAPAAVVLARMRATIEDVVRPLSRQLEDQRSDWIAPDPPPLPPNRLDWVRAVRQGLDPARIRPLMLTSLIAWTAIVPMVGSLGVAKGLLGVVAIVVVGSPLLWVAKRLGSLATDRSGGTARAVAFVLALLVPAAVFAQFVLAFARWAGVTEPSVVLVPALVLIVGLLIGVADSAQTQARDLEAQLEAAASERRWGLARARQEDRQHRLALAHAVHGRVQATVAAAMLELEVAMAEGRASDELVAEVQQRVVDCVVDLDLRSVEPDAVGELMRKVQAAWSGVIEVEWSATSEGSAALAADRQCLAVVNDLVPGLVFDSMHHGGAQHVELTVSLPDEWVLELLVRDDGGYARERGETSTALLDDCAIRWEQTTVDGTATSTCILLPVVAGQH